MSNGKSNLTIKVKVRAVFVSLIVVLLLVAILAFFRLGEIGDSAANVRVNVLPTTQLLGQMTEDFQSYRILQAEHVLAVDAKAMDKIEADMTSASDKMTGLRAKIEPLLKTAEIKAHYHDFGAAWEDLLASGAELNAASRKGDDEKTVKAYRDHGGKAFNAVDKAISDVVALNIGYGNRAALDGEEAASSTEWLILGAILFSLAICVFGTFFVGSQLLRPILGINEVMVRLSQNDLTVPITGAERQDEIGSMVRSVVVFKDNMAHNAELSRIQQEEQVAKERRQKLIDEHIAAFARTVSLEIDQLSQAADRMRGASQQLSRTATETSTQANQADRAAQLASSNVESVASATGELASTVSEISRQVDLSSQIARKAVDEADRTNTTIQGLADAAQRIGDVMQLIGHIASQTRLLALNATIEAARAGEAGKGFAVVASEVRNLATQTASATDDIALQIGAIQTATQDAVQAISHISGTITEISDISTAISAAVEEQGATTLGIKHNTEEAATGTHNVSDNISRVSAGAGQTGTAAAEVLSSATELGQQSANLRREITEFLDKIRAA